MSNAWFAFKQFTIQQDRCAMKVGTDGVLLGAWVNVEGAARILDAGAGTGLIAIMLAQRSQALIEAVEIDEAAFTQARENISACPWKERIRILYDSLQHFVTASPGLYDVIVPNPPYFRNSLRSPSKTRSVARHDESLSYESLLFCAAQLLSAQGRLAIIIPAAETDRFTELAYFHGLFPSRLVMVRPSPDKNPVRCLVEFTKDRNRRCEEGSLIIRNKESDAYTEDYKKLTEKFYL
jgi:tRNA1Val (adenine37-N6)-methyltransferase